MTIVVVVVCSVVVVGGGSVVGGLDTVKGRSKNGDKGKKNEPIDKNTYVHRDKVEKNKMADRGVNNLKESIAL